MRAQLLLSAITTAMLSGLLGMWLLSSAAARSEQTFLDGELRTSEQAVRRQLEVRRSARGAAYQALARQPLTRESLVARNYAQLNALAQSCRLAGADAVAIVDVASGLLAKEGSQAEPLALVANTKDLSEAATLVAVAGTVMDGWRIPIGADPPLGYLIAADTSPDAGVAAIDPQRCEVCADQILGRGSI